jgi:serine/threonine protein kinase
MEKQRTQKTPDHRSSRRSSDRSKVTPATPSTAASTPATVGPSATPPSSATSEPSAGAICRHGWRKGKEIGAGAFGRVYKAQDKVTGYIFAVKIGRDKDGDGGKHFDALQKELEICKSLRHKHIVSYLGHDYHAKDKCLHIFLEYAPGGSLRHTLSEFGPLEASLLTRASRGILKGLGYLHTHDPPISHRDLKGSNVLVDLNFTAKLADFGCSKCDVNSKTFSTQGSVLWMAPEVLQGCGYGRAADIWSFGCTVIEMATASDPWGPGAFDNQLQAIYAVGASERTPPLPESATTPVRELLNVCLRRGADERPNAIQLLDYELVRRDARPMSRTSMGSRERLPGELRRESCVEMGRSS